MANCPVCNTEYGENQRERCSKCDWILALNLPSGTQPSEPFSQIIQKPELREKLLNWAKSKHEELEKLKIQVEQFTQERDDYKIKFEDAQKQLSELRSPKQVLNQHSDTTNADRLKELENKYKEICTWKSEINEWKNNTEKRFEKLDNTTKEENKFLESEFQKLSNVVASQQEKIQELNQKIEQLLSSYQEPQNSVTETQNYNQEISLSPEERQILDLYQKDKGNKGELFNSVIQVNATEESINNTRLGGKDIILAKIPRGNYWIVNHNNFYYLVPRKGITINQHSYNTAEILFECKLKQQERTQKFRLLKPGKVFALPEGEQWRLQDKGILEFY